MKNMKISVLSNALQNSIKHNNLDIPAFTTSIVTSPHSHAKALKKKKAVK